MRPLRCWQPASGLPFYDVAVFRLLRRFGWRVTLATLRALAVLWRQSGDCCVARYGQESFTPLRALAMRVPSYFLIGAHLLPKECQLGVPNRLNLRISAAAVTGPAYAATKVGRGRTDALQVRKRHFPTPINARLLARRYFGKVTTGPEHHGVPLKRSNSLPALIWVGGCRCGLGGRRCEMSPSYWHPKRLQ